MAGIRIKADSVSISPSTTRDVELECDGVDEGVLAIAIESDDSLRDSVLDEIGIDRVVEHFGTSKVLDAIGQDAAGEHFGLVKES